MRRTRQWPPCRGRSPAVDYSQPASSRASPATRDQYWPPKRGTWARFGGAYTAPMAVNRRTYRVVDGEQIEGTWRPIFIRNGSTYFLTDLLVFADGAINCWDWVDLDGLRAKLASGWVATQLKPGAEVSAHDLA